MLQPKLNLKVSQRQILTPGLVQMVSVLALNKLELKEMINTEMVENPVLEEIEESGITLDEMADREAEMERSAEDTAKATEQPEKDPFEEIDFGSYFQDYLDPGYRTTSNYEDIERPSFENFLSQPSTLTDHLTWQLGAMNLSHEMRTAADLIVGNLNEDGYLVSTDEELAEQLLESREPARPDPIPFERGKKTRLPWEMVEESGTVEQLAAEAAQETAGCVTEQERAHAVATVQKAREIVNNLDPVGVGARNLRECLLIQIAALKRDAEMATGKRMQSSVGVRNADEHTANEENELAEADAPVSAGNGIPSNIATAQNGTGRNGKAEHVGYSVFETAGFIIVNHLQLLQKRDMRELTRCCGKSAEEVQATVEFIRTLDPRPGQRYNVSQTRLIEPDVAFVKRDGEYVVIMNEEDMPSLRLSHAYRKMLREKGTEKDVRDYVKERYKSAIQLLRNIEQRKNTIVRTCESIVRRQGEFLERGEEGLKPMMIKEVAEEIGVHPSTVSRAVANKYVHTPQGVYELRYFFSEGVNGPEGADLPLVLLKRKVKKLIEDEDPSKPLTDDQLAAELQRQGIKVTRRTVAKYREDMQIPSTHQRRVR